MPDPIYLGVNELGIQVWEIEEGGMRPLVDDRGKIKCEWCEEVKLPTRIGLTRDRSDAEWVVLACPDCGMAHCVMKVKLYRSTAHVPRMTKATHEGIADDDADAYRRRHGIATHFVPDGRGGEIEMSEPCSTEVCENMAAIREADGPGYCLQCYAERRVLFGEDKEMTGGKLHYADPKEKVKAGIEVAVAHGKKRTG